jgi:hypothetical protein
VASTADRGHHGSGRSRETYLLVKLQEVLGEKDAATLMEHLPPDRWDELATKRDLERHLERVDARFDQVDARFEQVDARFDQVDARFEQVDARFDRLEHRFGQFEHRFDGLEQRFDGLEHRFGQLEHRFDLSEQRFDATQQRTEDRFAAFAAHFDERLEHQHDRLLVALHERIDRQTRLLLFTILGALVTMALVGAVGG